MKGLRFSLKGMLAAVALVAFACVALLNATVVWACIAFTATVILLLLAAVGSLYREAERRACYVGASLFGWTYMLSSFGPGFSDTTKPLLASTPLLELLYSQVDRPIDIQYGPGGVLLDLPKDAVIIQPRTPLAYRFPIAKHFHTVGHSLFALIFAGVGGLVARFLYMTSRRESGPEVGPNGRE